MTKLWKRAGAMTLALAMSLSLILGNVPALAAGTTATYTRPELVMDFLGDNNVYNSGNANTAQGDGINYLPANKDWSTTDNGVDGKWNKYLSSHVGTATVPTIFWIGIGIKDVDQFILSNGGKGLYSAELGLYYNPEFVEPYVPDGQDFATVFERYNFNQLGNSVNQWSRPDYQVAQALTDMDPLNDPNDVGALGDPTTPAQGYGTEEFSAPDTWRMTYVSIERRDSATGDPRFSDSANYSDKDTYYIAMIPFVLKAHDANEELCIRLARNASVFSIGGAQTDANNSGMGSVEYGNWDKYTYHDPAHDLKLMFDYTGDLNIFKNERDRIDDQWAQLNIVNNSGSVQNYAQMIINNEPYTPPSQIAVANYDGTPTATDRRIIQLSGGEELRVSAHKGSGFTVSISVVEVTSNNTITPTQITTNATTGSWTDEWTYIMPTGTDVMVTVTFSGSATVDTEYTATLVVEDNGHNESANTAQLSKPGGVATAVLQTGTDSIKATMNTTMTVSVKRNSDYNVTVTLTEANSGNVTVLSPSVSSATALTYTFTMPADDVEVKVEFTEVDKFDATLALDDADGKAGNTAQLSYVDGTGALQTGTMISGLGNPNSHTLEDVSVGRVVTVTTGCDPEYQVKQVHVYRNGVQSQTVAVSHVTGSNLYTFTMPAFDVDVVVVYEKIKTYKVRLILVDYKNGEGATLNGVDGRVTAATPHTVTLNSTMDASTAPTTGPNWMDWQPDAALSAANSIEVFGNAQMSVGINGLQSGRTASIEVFYPVYPLDPVNGDVINTAGSAASGFTFNMVPLNDPDNDVVYVVVTFKNTASTALTARIREIRETGVPTTTGGKWSALGHNNDITAYAGDQLSVTINVDPGYYISSIQVFDDNGTYTTTDGTATETGAPLGVPVSLSGIGYNNGNGGTETATFTMPSVNATLLIQYKKGPPDPEPSFTAAIRKDTSLGGDGTVSITNVTAGGTVYTTSTGSWVNASTSDLIKATYTPDANSYVAGVTVTADVPGTSVLWSYLPGGGVEVTMPAANVVVTVEFADASTATSHDLTIAKNPADPDGNTVAVAAKSVTVTDVSQTTSAYENELIVADVYVAPYYYISKVELNGVSIPYSGSGYNGGAGGNETVVFNMPQADATLTVYFKDSRTDPPGLTLAVTEPSGGGNTATLTATSQTATASTPVTANPTPVPGSTVEVKVTPQTGYSVDIPILTTPTGAVSITWTSTDTFTFVMPNDNLTVTVPFKTGDPTQFYANLIFRGDATGVALAEGTFGDYDDLTSGTLVYSRAAQPGETIPYAVKIPDGYYISDVSVTPAAFGVTPTITGMIGQQQGQFLMPAGNVYLNITIAKGWPDEVIYPVRLHVTAPNDGTNYSSAALTNTATNVTTGNVPAGTADTSGSGSVTALDGERMLVTFAPASGHVLDSVTAVTGNNDPVTYQWTTGPGGELAIGFNVPGSSVDVYVTYTEKTSTSRSQEVILHASGMNGESITITNTATSVAESLTGLTGNGTTASIMAYAGDKFQLDVSGGSTGYTAALITSAYAITATTGTLIDLTPALAGTFVGAEPSSTFLMPIQEDVDVYLNFKSVTTPGADQYILTLQVTGPSGSGGVTVKDYLPGSTTVAGTMSATAVGSDAMVVTHGDTITAQVTAQPGYALYSLIAYTAAGDRVIVSLDSTNPTGYWDTYTFTMPADTTHIEAEFRAAEPNGYQIQVVVNNTVNGGQGANDANLYTPPGDTNAFKFMSGVSAGTAFELGLQIASGYQVDSIIAVPQNSGVAVNIPLPAITSTGTQIMMPASDLVIYVTFKLDTTTRYNVIGKISYETNVTPPTSGTNMVRLDGNGSGQFSIAVSDSTQSSDARIQEAKDETVTATWTCATGYVVSSYTVTNLQTGQPVLSQPLYDATGAMIGIEFVMPGANVEVDVKFTDPNTAAPATFTATLHYLDYDATTGSFISCAGAASGAATDGDYATITDHGNAAVTTAVDGGVITSLTVGSQVDITAQPGGGTSTGRYLQSLYVLQNGQMIPLQFSGTTAGLDTTTAGALSEAYIQMPSGNVDVYAVFSDHQRDPDEFIATVQVNGPAGTNLQDNEATITGPHTGTTPDPSATAQGGQGPAAILVDRNGTVTVTITVASGYEVDRVEGAPILLLLQPQMSPTDPLVYTFTMPASDASIIVTLKEKAISKYPLNLHVSHVNAPASPSESGNVTTLHYGDPATDSVQISGSGDDTLQVPENTTVTLTVEPQAPTPDSSTTEGYYVRAAYGVYQNQLIQLTPVIPTTFTPAVPRTSAGLEGVTDDDVQAEANTATFSMPAGTTDVYVVYEYGFLPTDPWYNVVVIATDTGGATNNTGQSEVEVSSITSTSGGTNAIDPAQSVFSNGVATNFYSVPAGETIHLDATGAATGYQYDTTNPMSLSSQVSTVTLPTLTNADPTNHPLGEIQEFTMPAGNIGALINFKTTGTTGLKATLHVTTSGSVPGYPDNTVTMTVVQGTVTRSVDNSSPEGDPTRTLTDLVSNDTLTIKIDPKDPDTRVVRVVVTTVDPTSGTVIGTYFALNPAPNEYTYIMGDKDVHVYVDLAEDTDTDRFIAVATPVYNNGLTDNGGQNVITGVTNVTTSGLNSAPFWTEVKASDGVKVEFKAEPNVYVTVTAYDITSNPSSLTGIPIGVAQFGVGNGSSGWAQLFVPNPGCDVRIEVTFSTDPPNPQDLTFVSTDHEGLVDNTATLDIDRTAPPKNTETLTPPATPSLADLSYVFTDYTSATPAGDDERVTPGTGLDLSATLATDYAVSKVEIIVHTSAGDVTLTYYLEQNTAGGWTLMDIDFTQNPVVKTPVTLVMPTAATTIKVYFELAKVALLPYDPETIDPDNDNDPYKDHWITSENRGDYLIVTVPMLNNDTGTNPTDVTWDYQVKEDRFNFYLREDPATAGDPYTYTPLNSILKMSRPDGTPAPGANDPTDYVLDNFYTDTTGTTPVAYTGAQFVLTVLTDAEIDADPNMTTADKAAAKTLAATMRAIMDNEGTADTSLNNYRLSITCEETTYTNGTPSLPVESDYVDFEVPRYYSLVGELISYAPTHIATFTLTDGATTNPNEFITELQGDNGTEQWRQGFKMKLTSDWDKLDDSSYTFTLTIEKPGHITYTHNQILLDTTAAFYNSTELQFSFSGPITLICGDIDNDGSTWERDVSFLTGLMYGKYSWTEETSDTATGWAKSIYNPDSLAYAADLNGDYALSMKDLDILTGPDFGSTAAAYGTDTGLQVSSLSLLSLKAPEPELPDGLQEMLDAGQELPDWVWEAVDSGVEIPDWAITLLQSGQTVPDWAVELILAGEPLPDEALAMLDAGETLPEEWPVAETPEVPAEELPTEEVPAEEVTEEEVLEEEVLEEEVLEEEVLEEEVLEEEVLEEEVLEEEVLEEEVSGEEQTDSGDGETAPSEEGEQSDTQAPEEETAEGETSDVDKEDTSNEEETSVDTSDPQEPDEEETAEETTTGSEAGESGEETSIGSESGEEQSSETPEEGSTEAADPTETTDPEETTDPAETADQSEAADEGTEQVTGQEESGGEETSPAGSQEASLSEETPQPQVEQGGIL